MNIVFRADASMRIGTGHIMRCLTLADTLASVGHICTFIIRNHSGHLADLIRQRGYRVALMSRPDPLLQAQTVDTNYANWLGASWQADAEETITLLQGVKPEWLIVDHYAIDCRWHKAVRPVVGKILVIDDLADRKLDCDVLLNQNYGCTEADYQELVNYNCKLLLGSQYALLRPEFAALRQQAINKRKTYQGIRRILISMGGTDPDNVTSLVLESLASVGWADFPFIDVVLNGKAPHLKSVIELAERHPFPVSVTVDANDMARLMFLADLAIGAGGSTNWERCCLGLPSLVIITAENQTRGIQILTENGVVFCFKIGELIGLLKAISTVWNSQDWLLFSKNSFSITDGLGSNLVMRELVLYAPEIHGSS